MSTLLRLMAVCIMILVLYPQAISSAEQGSVSTQQKISQQVMDIEHIQWQPNGDLIAAGEIFDVIVYTDRFQEVWRIPRPSAGFVESVAWSPDGSRIGIIYTPGDREWVLRVWNVETQLLELSLGEQDVALYYPTIVWDPAGNRFAIGVEQKVEIREALSGQLLFTLDDFESEITALAWSPDGTQLVTANISRLKTWDTTDWTQLNSHYFSEGVDKVIWSPDSSLLAITLSHTESITLWDSANFQAVATLEGHTRYIRALDWNSSGGLASVSNDNTLKVWDIETQQPAQEFQVNSLIFAIAWSPDGTRLVYGGEDGILEILNVQPSTSCPSSITAGDVARLITSMNAMQFIGYINANSKAF